ncbi:MAG TPA: RDD family protein [bacterium]|jgi:uncharacterized RDD family membrane protein YckC
MRSKAPRTYQPVATEHVNSLVGVPLAGFWSRLAAFAMDLVIVIPFAGIQEILKNLDQLLKPNQDVKLEINPFHSWGLIPTVLYFALALYWGNGRTVGKRLMHIRVVSLTHKHISFWHALERALGYGASVLEGGFGFVQFFIHPNRQTVHDRIAETIVVKEPRKAKTPLPEPTEPS